MDDQLRSRQRLRAHAAAHGIDWSRVDDHDVAQFLAWAVPAPEDTKLRVTGRLVPKATAPAPAPAAAAPAPRANRAEPAAAPAVSQDTLSPNVDAAATAQNLRDAAEAGVPFCEECARAAR